MAGHLTDGRIVELSVPFLPGMALAEVGQQVAAVFDCQGAVAIPDVR